MRNLVSIHLHSPAGLIREETYYQPAQNKAAQAQYYIGKTALKTLEVLRGQFHCLGLSFSIRLRLWTGSF